MIDSDSKDTFDILSYNNIIFQNKFRSIKIFFKLTEIMNSINNWQKMSIQTSHSSTELNRKTEFKPNNTQSKNN